MICFNFKILIKDTFHEISLHLYWNAVNLFNPLNRRVYYYLLHADHFSSEQKRSQHQKRGKVSRSDHCTDVLKKHINPINVECCGLLKFKMFLEQIPEEYFPILNVRWSIFMRQNIYKIISKMKIKWILKMLKIPTCATINTDPSLLHCYPGSDSCDDNGDSSHVFVTRVACAKRRI